MAHDVSMMREDDDVNDVNDDVDRRDENDDEEVRDGVRGEHEPVHGRALLASRKRLYHERALVRRRELGENPGASKDDPNVYRFGEATYEEILQDLKRQDEKLYAQKGLIGMLERNMQVKRKPERWHEDNSDDGEFDVVVCFEERVFDLVLADMREERERRPVFGD